MAGIETAMQRKWKSLKQNVETWLAQNWFGKAASGYIVLQAAQVRPSPSQGPAGDPCTKKEFPFGGVPVLGVAPIGPPVVRWLTVSTVLPFPGFGLGTGDFELSGFVSKWAGKRPQG